MRCIGLLCVVALVAGSASARGRESSRLVVPLSPVGGSGGDIEGTDPFYRGPHDATSATALQYPELNCARVY